MNPRTLIRRLTGQGGRAVLAAVAMVAGMQAAASGAQTSVTPRPAPITGPAAGNPYSPAYQHPYRHGTVPMIPQQQKMNKWAAGHPRAATAASAGNLNYGGGVDGIGVTTGQEKVYLVFYGSQWGSQGLDAQGDVTLSGDPSGMAPYLQRLMKGLGTDNELWSGVMTQYCQDVALGAQSCPASSTQRVAYPAGGALAGVWADESTASPQQATGNQLGAEAVNAAAHFGNTSAASNRDAQYVIISPTGTNPDGWLDYGFCAWHDYNRDPLLSGGPVTSPYGDVAFTNLPYITDAGSNCGANFVNAQGPLDGVSMVAGHEYAETITDQNPAGGWTDSSGSEAADKCAWITPGADGGAFDLSTATGTFAMQTIWGNDRADSTGGCEAYHVIMRDGAGGANNVYVTTGGTVPVGTVRSPLSIQVNADDTAPGQTFRYTATGLPAGVTINPATGLISGRPTAAHMYTVTVTAADTTGASGSTTFPLSIQLLGNPGFETGSLAPWVASTPKVLINYVRGRPHSGYWLAWLDGYGQARTDTLAQAVTIPSTCQNPTLSFWLAIYSNDPADNAYDTFTVQLLTPKGGVLATLATLSNLDAKRKYVQYSYSLAGYAGQKITVKYTGKETLGGNYVTTFFNDDNAMTCA